MNEFEVDATAVDNSNKAHVRIMSMIEKGTSRASNVIEKIMTEVPQDYVVPSSMIRFTGDEGKIKINLENGVQAELHRNALDQVAEDIKMPKKWINQIYGLFDSEGEDGVNPYGAKLIAHSFNEVLRRNGSRHLVRIVTDSRGPQLRGFLSDRFRRLDARPIMEKLFAAFQQVGLRPYDGYALDTRVEIQAIIPKIYSPYDGELVAFGLTFRSSDYGDGALDVKGFTIRPACANGMIRESIMREVHLGKRISSDLMLSQKTYDLDTAAYASAVYDVVSGAFSDNKIESEMMKIRDASQKALEPKKAETLLRKMLSEGDAKQAMALFSSPDIVTLPPGQNNYRMSNAISWLANNSKDERTKIELQEVAGEWLLKG